MTKIYGWLVAIGLIILIWSAISYITIKVYDEYLEVKGVMATVERFVDAHETRLDKLEKIFIENSAAIAVVKAKKLGRKGK
uniref:Uncharacterized protein n=1 Tax=viral metagenome TaxID=1070528 RepID=A0A6M3K6L7_9ZZZZ